METPRNSDLVQAFEEAWDVIRENFSELPEAIITIGPTSRGRKNTKLGHWAKQTWELKDNPHTLPEVLVSAEGLNREPADVFETLLHESAHALATARDISDCSSNNYHTKRYKLLAEEVGLEVERHSPYGFAYTKLAEGTADKYASAIANIEEVLKAYRYCSKKQNKKAPNLYKLSCGCGHTIRVGRKVLEEALIRCDDCGMRFLEPLP